MRCEHEHDDGAYVLGALSPAERMAYERHLATCSFCREAVRDIATLPDLLSRLDAAEFAKLVDPSLSAEEHRYAPARRVPPAGRHNKKTLPVRILSCAAAALLVALVGVGVFAWGRSGTSPTTPPGPAVAMTAVAANSPVTATVRLTSTPGGTKIDVVCTYSKSATHQDTFHAVVYGPDGEHEDVGSWLASPGGVFTMPGVTHFALGSLSRVELAQSDGKVMLAYDVP